MSIEVIEGEAVEIPQDRAVVVAQPGQALVAADGPDGPEQMLSKATAIATTLAKMVEQQKLYTVIQGRKFPHVEAWMTIGRMDNVVARESRPPVRNEDGSYEAFVELVRLSDGMIVGGGSAMCGAPDDPPWGGSPARNGRPAQPARPEHQRRSMAVTRATSRAFRQDYAWVMALAGYEVTPADEMPVEDKRDRFADSAYGHETPATTHADGLQGTAEMGKGDADWSLRQDPDHGHRLAFRLVQGRKGYKVVALGSLAEALTTMRPAFEGQKATVWGTFHDETFTPKGETREVTYQIVHLERIQTADYTLPADESIALGQVAAFDQAESDRIDAEAVA